jgi:hypothetical protein
MWKTWVGLENEMTVSSNAAGNHGKIIKNLSPNFPPRKSALNEEKIETGLDKSVFIEGTVFPGFSNENGS